MPIYHKLGKIPPKRHTQFRNTEGGLYYEQLFGTVGFDGMSTLMYQIHRPTMVKEVLSETDVAPKIAVPKNIKARLLKGFDVPPQDDYLDSRTPLLVNSDIHIGLAAPKKSLTKYFYKNADADEMLFVHRGSGTLRTQLGNIKFEYGDYLIIPRGMIYQIEFNTSDNRLLFAESFHPIYTPMLIADGIENHAGFKMKTGASSVVQFSGGRWEILGWDIRPDEVHKVLKVLRNPVTS